MYLDYLKSVFIQNKCVFNIYTSYIIFLYYIILYFIVLIVTFKVGSLVKETMREKERERMKGQLDSIS